MFIRVLVSVFSLAVCFGLSPAFADGSFPVTGGGGGGVNSVIAGTNVTLTGTASDPIINASGGGSGVGSTTFANLGDANCPENPGQVCRISDSQRCDIQEAIITTESLAWCKWELVNGAGAWIPSSIRIGSRGQTAQGNEGFIDGGVGSADHIEDNVKGFSQRLDRAQIARSTSWVWAPDSAPLGLNGMAGNDTWITSSPDDFVTVNSAIAYAAKLQAGTVGRAGTTSSIAAFSMGTPILGDPGAVVTTATAYHAEDLDPLGALFNWGINVGNPVKLRLYPNTKDDIGVPINVISTDAFGELQSHPVGELPGGGDVTGPSGATADKFAQYDGATGKLLKDSTVGPADFSVAPYDIEIDLSLPDSCRRASNALKGWGELTGTRRNVRFYNRGTPTNNDMTAYDTENVCYVEGPAGDYAQGETSGGADDGWPTWNSQKPGADFIQEFFPDQERRKLTVTWDPGSGFDYDCPSDGGQTKTTILVARGMTYWQGRAPAQAQATFTPGSGPDEQGFTIGEDLTLTGAGCTDNGDITLRHVHSATRGSEIEFSHRTSTVVAGCTLTGVTSGAVAANLTSVNLTPERELGEVRDSVRWIGAPELNFKGKCDGGQAFQIAAIPVIPFDQNDSDLDGVVDTNQTVTIGVLDSGWVGNEQPDELKCHSDYRAVPWTLDNNDQCYMHVSGFGNTVKVGAQGMQVVRNIMANYQGKMLDGFINRVGHSLVLGADRLNGGDKVFSPRCVTGVCGPFGNAAHHVALYSDHCDGAEISCLLSGDSSRIDLYSNHQENIIPRGYRGRASFNLGPLVCGHTGQGVPAEIAYGHVGDASDCACVDLFDTGGTPQTSGSPDGTCDLDGTNTVAGSIASAAVIPNGQQGTINVYGGRFFSQATSWTQDPATTGLGHSFSIGAGYVKRRPESGVNFFGAYLNAEQTNASATAAQISAARSAGITTACAQPGIECKTHYVSPALSDDEVPEVNFETAHFNMPGTLPARGAVMRNTKIRTVNPIDFGATPHDNTDDDTAALNAAVSALSTGDVRASGSHTGSDNAAVLTDSGAAFTEESLAWRVHNTADGSSCLVTGYTATTLTCATGLQGGTDNDWDVTGTLDPYELKTLGGGKVTLSCGEYRVKPTVGFIDSWRIRRDNVTIEGESKGCVVLSDDGTNGPDGNALPYVCDTANGLACAPGNPGILHRGFTMRNVIVKATDPTAMMPAYDNNCESAGAQEANGCGDDFSEEEGHGPYVSYWEDVLIEHLRLVDFGDESVVFANVTRGKMLHNEAVGAASIPAAGGSAFNGTGTLIDIEIAHNHVRGSVDDPTSCTGGFACINEGSGINIETLTGETVRNISIHHNTVDGNEFKHGIRITASGSDISDLSITDNYISNHDDDCGKGPVLQAFAEDCALSVTSGGSFVIRGLRVANNTIIGGVQLRPNTAGVDWLVTGNTIKGLDQPESGLVVGNTGLTLSGNLISGFGHECLYLSSNLQDSLIFLNQFKDCATVSNTHMIDSFADAVAGSVVKFVSNIVDAGASGALDGHLLLWRFSNSVVSDNVFTTDAGGVATDDAINITGGPDRFKIQRNAISNVDNNAIHVSSTSDDWVAEDNEIFDTGDSTFNGEAIRVDAGSNGIVRRNSIRDAWDGLRSDNYIEDFGATNLLCEGNTVDDTNDSHSADIVCDIESANLIEATNQATGGDPGTDTCKDGTVYVDTDETVDTNCTTTADDAVCVCVAGAWVSNQ